MKYLVLILILSGCTKNALTSRPEVSSEMYQSSDKICAQNGGIASIELFKENKETKAYVTCKKQGLVQIDSSGHVSNVTHPIDSSIQSETISDKIIENCQNKCKNKVKTINPVTCECN